MRIICIAIMANVCIANPTCLASTCSQCHTISGCVWNNYCLPYTEDIANNYSGYTTINDTYWWTNLLLCQSNSCPQLEVPYQNAYQMQLEKVSPMYAFCSFEMNISQDSVVIKSAGEYINDKIVIILQHSNNKFTIFPMPQEYQEYTGNLITRILVVYQNRGDFNSKSLLFDFNSHGFDMITTVSIYVIVFLILGILLIVVLIVLLARIKRLRARFTRAGQTTRILTARQKLHKENKITMYCQKVNYTVDSSKYKEVLCTICLNQFTEGLPLRMLANCLHIFHEECITQWVNTNIEKEILCPNCNCPLIREKKIITDDMTHRRMLSNAVGDRV